MVRSRVVLGLALLVVGCGGDAIEPAAPLEITSRVPGDGASAVETGAVVEVVFNREIEPASLTGETFRLRLGGLPLPSAFTYDASTRTARAVAPFLPDGRYEVEVSTGVRPLNGAGLAEGEQWTFTTRPWEATTVDDAGTVGLYTSLALDRAGRIHVSYHDLDNRDLKYAVCTADCAAAASWDDVSVDTPGTVGAFSSLAVDATGRVHVTYYDNTNFDLKYATCGSACTSVGSWESAAVDTDGDVGAPSSLVAGPGGRLHVAYFDQTNGDLKYATCAAACASTASWETAAVQTGGDVGYYPWLEVDGEGGVHVSHYSDSEGLLFYATCAASCANAGNWQAAAVTVPGLVGDQSSLAVDASGRVHLSYYDYTNQDLRYAVCAGACSTTGSWESAAVDTAGQVGAPSSLAADASGRLHVSYRDGTHGDLKYATCARACMDPENWRAVAVHANGDVGHYNALAVDGQGRLHVSHFDWDTGTLKFIQ